MDITGRLSFFAALYKVNVNPILECGFIYYHLILGIIVYKLGFSHKTSVGKSI